MASLFGPGFDSPQVHKKIMAVSKADSLFVFGREGRGTLYNAVA